MFKLMVNQVCLFLSHHYVPKNISKIYTLKLNLTHIGWVRLGLYSIVAHGALTFTVARLLKSVTVVL